MPLSAAARSARRQRAGAKYSRPSNSLSLLIDRLDLDQISNVLATEKNRINTDQLNNALLHAASLGNTKICGILITAGADPNCQENPVAHAERHELCSTFSCEQGLYASWVEKHTSVGGTSLHRAVENSHHDCAELLLKNGANVNAKDIHGVTSLMLACMRRGCSKTVDMLINTYRCQVCVSESRKGMSAIHYTAEVADVNMLKVLLESGEDVDRQDKNQNTPLIYVSTTPVYEPPKWKKRETENCILVLVEKNCFVNLLNSDNHTALHKAVLARDIDIVDLLTENSAQVSNDVIRTAFIGAHDSAILENLLSSNSELDNEFLVCMLVYAIVVDASKWNFNNQENENIEHQIARVLLKYITNIDVACALPSREWTYIENLLTTEIAKNMDKENFRALLELGLTGLALQHGKYGIAHMLYLSGCTITRSTLNKLEVLTDVLISSHPALSDWLPKALSPPPSLSVACRKTLRKSLGSQSSVASLDDAKLQDYIDMIDLDRVNPYDASVKGSVDIMMDEKYAQREGSKAGVCTVLWIYQ